MSAAEVSEGLGLDTLKNRQWSIFKSCAIKGEGLEEGLDWCASSRRLSPSPTCRTAAPLTRDLVHARPRRLATALQNK